MNNSVVEELKNKFNTGFIRQEETRDEIPTIWIKREELRKVLSYLKNEIHNPYKMLYDLTAIDERAKPPLSRTPGDDFTVIYHLLSFDRNEDIRIKVPLTETDLTLPSITHLWQNSDWYEREVFDMFGINFEGHPHLSRILMPLYWEGYPLRKEHPARATEMGPFQMPEEAALYQQDVMEFNPDNWGLKREGDHDEFMFLNLGPQHPGTHGILRLVLQLDGEEILNVVPDIGFHHRGAEKMGERQSWHTYIPYTDRIDYLGGVMNNLAYVLAVEKLAGIEVPLRAQFIRVMICEFFRLASHLVWYGTFAQDLGMLSPVFYMFSDRERIFDIVAAVCGDRMHPNWFRIGGVAQDLPNGWEKLVKNYLNYLPKRLKDYDRMVMRNRIFKGRTVGIGVYDTNEAIEWGITGPGLRATGYDWDFRKRRPYSGYDKFEFDIPVGSNGDCYDRALVRIEEMRQSLRIIEQCMKNMPEGTYKSEHPLTTPPVKNYTMHDIETLITHFLSVSWGPVIPEGEAFMGIEATKGNNGYYLVSSGDTIPYRVRIRTPSFPNIQMVSYISRGYTVADLLSILGSIDFVLSDIDR